MNSERIEKQQSSSPSKQPESISASGRTDNARQLSRINEVEMAQNNVNSIDLRANEFNKHERESFNSSNRKRKRMNARSYRLLFSPQQRKAFKAENGWASNQVKILDVEHIHRKADNSSSRSTSQNIDLVKNDIGDDREGSHQDVREQSLKRTNANFSKITKKFQAHNGELSSSGQESADRNERISLHCATGNMAQESNLCTNKEEKCKHVPNGNIQFPNSSSCMDRYGLEDNDGCQFSKKCNGNLLGTNEYGCAAQLEGCPSNVEKEPIGGACAVCKFGGELVSCHGKGCKRDFHISCLGHPFADIPLIGWHCFWCVNKKVQFGVHSVTEGVESIWDTKEVEVPNSEGSQREKQYFVKYKGLAHIHNRWVSEAELLVVDPLVLAKSNPKNQWRFEWTMPHRVLQKRVVPFQKMLDLADKGQAHAEGFYVEWLVKWKGLGYECATWEVENLFDTFEAKNLIRDYESRCNKAKGDNDEMSKAHESSSSVIKPLELPGLDHREANGSYMTAIKGFRDRWQQKCNCLVFDEHDRVAKIVLYILSFQCYPNQPFLIIAPPAALAYWEAEFSRLAPTVALVTYTGSKTVRKHIRLVEFYTEAGCVLLQVLLSSPEIVVEDLKELQSLRWDVVIIDECNKSKLSKHLQHLKVLVANIWFVFVNGQIKDRVGDYLNLLPFVASCGIENFSSGLMADSNETVASLKEKFSRVISYDCRSCSSRFVEFWVPVRLSNVQLEQYCATLVANFMVLRSFSKIDTIDALRDIVISVWKCCDHPYTVDISLQAELTAGFSGTEILDFGIKASGKLQLLDSVLRVIKDRGLRVLILFQSIRGSARDKIGDILEDFTRLRFGTDSYERIDGGGFLPSKKQTVLNKFNDRESGRFVFLLEKSACSPSIKLISVSVVIIFDSDWNPMNDFRALQKIAIDSDIEPIKVFRLYSSYTIEEKILVLAKKDLPLDSNFQSIIPSISHMLLIWGTSHLFKKLEEFHRSSVEPADSDNSDKLFQNLLHEFSDLLSQNGEAADSSSSLISRVHITGGGYSTNMSLPGEFELEKTDDEQPQFFWAKMLDGLQPQWKLSSWLSQRSRKRGQHFDGLPKEPEGVPNNRKKVDKENMDSREQEAGAVPVVASVHQPGSAPAGDARKTIRSSVSPTMANASVHQTSSATADDARNSDPLSFSPTAADEARAASETRDIQENNAKNLHVLLKSELTTLCEVLQFPDDVKAMVMKFLDYILNNHHISSESPSILQALKISMCRVAVTILNFRTDHKRSLALARQHLGFCCTEEEADFIYEKLVSIKDTFLHREPGTEHESLKNTSSISNSNCEKGNIMELRSPGTSIIKVQETGPESLKNTSPVSNFNCEKGNVLEPRSPGIGTIEGRETDMVHNLTDAKENLEGAQHVKKMLDQEMVGLLQKQKKDVMEFNKICEKEKLNLENWYRVESGIIRSLYNSTSVGSDKLKILESEFSKKMEEHRHHIAIRRKELEAEQFTARTHLKQKFHKLVELDFRARIESSGDRNPQLIEGGTLETALESSHRIGSASCEAGKSSICNQVGMHEQSTNTGSYEPSGLALEEARDAEIGRQSDPHEIDNAENQIDHPAEGGMSTTNEVSQNESVQPSKSCSSQGGHDPKNGGQDDGRNVDESLDSERVASIELNFQVLAAEMVAHHSNANQPCADASVLEREGPSQALQSLLSSKSSSSQSGCASKIKGQDNGSSVDDLLPPPHEIASSEHNSQFVDVEMVAQHSNPNQPCADASVIEEHSQENRIQSSQLPPAIEMRQNVSLETTTDPRSAISADSVRLEGLRFEPPQMPTNYTRQLTPPAPDSQHQVPDPLRDEMTRISKEIDDITRNFKGMKSHLKSEYEKEIEDAVAKIRAKYANLLGDAETGFSQSLKVLQYNYDLVMKNRALADAFRTKSFAHKATHQQRLHHGGSSSVQQPFQPFSAPQFPTRISQSIPRQLPSLSIRTSSSPAEIRAPAPHLQRFASLTTVPARFPPPHTRDPVLPSPARPPHAQASNPLALGGRVDFTPVRPITPLPSDLPPPNPGTRVDFTPVSSIGPSTSGLPLPDTFLRGSDDPTPKTGCANEGVVCLSDDD